MLQNIEIMSKMEKNPQTTKQKTHTTKNPSENTKI